jgi:glycosyltransferase involved in cell wall biosynthesis
MKTSIITVCYNSQQYIRSAIESVLSQTYSNLEYIVIDGGSTDETVSIIKKYESSFGGKMKWISEPDKGLYDAMNKGIEMATGEVIGILNSDDLFCEAQAIEKVMRLFNTNSLLDSVYADLYYVSQDDINQIKRCWINGEQKSFRSGWHPAHPTFYIKKDIYQKYGCFNLDFQLAADFELMLRFLEKYKISTVYLPDFLVKMRLGGASNKNMKNIYKQNRECIWAFRVNELPVNRFSYPFLRIIPKLFQ